MDGKPRAAVSDAAERFGIPAVVFLMENPSQQAKLATFGAGFSKVDPTSVTLFVALLTMGTLNAYISSTTQGPDLPADPATIASEIPERLAETDVWQQGWPVSKSQYMIADDPATRTTGERPSHSGARGFRPTAFGHRHNHWSSDRTSTTPLSMMLRL